MIRLLALLVMIPVSGWSAPAEIRSGEHDTFSRLVISIPIGAEWDLSEIEDGFRLELQGLEDGFDTTTVFDRIPRTRLTAVASDGRGALLLTTGCDCIADVFLWRSNRLVVDIVDPASVTPALRPVSPEQRDSSTSEGLPDLLSGMGPRATDILPFQAERPRSELQPGAVRNLPESNAADPVSDLAATEAALLEGLARAASQGFLQAAVDSTPDLGQDAEPDRQDEPSNISENPPHTIVSPGLGVSTALDRDLALLADVIGSATGQNCLSDTFFLSPDWAGDGDFGTQSPILIEALAGEFGSEPLDAQEALARFYLHYGFGAEAALVLTADDASSQARAILMELADFVDGRENAFTLIAAQAGCKTQGGLWAFVLAPKPLETETKDAHLRSFFAVPQPVRSHLAPRVVDAFLAANDPESASLILRAMENQDVAATHQAQVAEASVAVGLANEAEALRLLEEEAEDNPRTAPESVIQMITLALSRDELPKQSDLLLAATLRQEFRHEPIAADLEIAESLGRSAVGQFQEALDLVADRDDVDALRARDAAYAALTTRSETTDFLGFAYADIPDGLSPETENLIARRLIDLGFPERSITFLKGPAQREAAAERRYLVAEAALLSRDFSGAIEALRGMTDARARDLLTKAHIGLGDHDAALVSQGSAAEPDEQALQEFRAGAWDRLQDGQDGALAAFAGQVLRTLPDASETLEDRRTLLEQSADSRQAVEDLLLQFQSPVEDPIN